MNTYLLHKRLPATAAPLAAVAHHNRSLGWSECGRSILLAVCVILLAGWALPNALAAAGDLDLSFDPGSGADAEVAFVAILADGKLFIGGAFTMFNGVSRNGLARLNADGSLDPSFAPGELSYGDGGLFQRATVGQGRDHQLLNQQNHETR